MNTSEINLTQTSINKSIIDFSNKFNVNVSSLTVFPPMNDCFIQISPNNNHIAFVKNYSLEIYTKENGSWNCTLQHRISFDKKKIKVNFRTFIFGEITGGFDPRRNLLYGLNESKLALRGSILEYIGEFGVMTNKSMYNLYLASKGNQTIFRL